MIRYMLFEDEYFTSEALQATISNICPQYQLVGKGETVVQATALLDTNNQPDLVIASVQLADGDLIDSLQWLNCPCPLILMGEQTDNRIAHSGLNLIDYLLKPISAERLRLSIMKFESSVKY